MWERVKFIQPMIGYLFGKFVQVSKLNHISMKDDKSLFVLGCTEVIIYDYFN